ncbi:type VI secretion system ATPase TssH [Utexia brackfieldae]|uniref:type VI secretion system ATPase TssH n=1 Tax=Utexia brackfieldae TaxID=3074108 RepID=UPI00370D34EA
MIRIELPSLLKHLNPVSRYIFEGMAATCVNTQSSEMTVCHFLLQSLDTPLCDIRQIMAKANIDTERLQTLLTQLSYDHRQYEQSTPSFSPLLIELLQDAFLLNSAEFAQTNLRTGIILLTLLYSPHRYLPKPAVELLSRINRELLKSQFGQWVTGSAENSLETAQPVGSNSTVQADISLLDRYAIDITQQGLDGKLDPVLGRDKEIDLMIDILCRRRKNNPIVVGEAGVGKSALIEGLALRIIDNKVPEQLKQTRIMSLDLGALQAGASVKGEFEKRFKGIMADVSHSPTPIILFIDEAHTLIGAGNQHGGLDVSNLLKPALARGELKTIAATTWREYKQYFEKDAALSRRFQLVKVSEPTAAEAVIILRGLRKIYEQAHGVFIDDGALQACAYLSDRYLSGRQLPDKAIDVLDTACARISINLTSPPRQVSALQTQLHQYHEEIALLSRENQLGLKDNLLRMAELEQTCHETEAELVRIEELWQQQLTIVQRLIELRAQCLSPTEPFTDHNFPVLAVTQPPDLVPAETSENIAIAPIETDTLVNDAAIRAELDRLSEQLANLQQDAVLVSPHVDEKQIAAVIAEHTGIPLKRISQDELAVVTHLPQYLNTEIKGQYLAIEQLHRHLLTARADLRRTGRPLGAFLLVGPSGVGKTESVIQIAELLFGGRQYLTTINMSEYQEKHTVSRLIGSPPGYVGYGEGGILTESIRQKPYSVVLLDEVEKAHRDVLNLFYQAFDKGELADGEGRVIDCKNVLFFLTSNLGDQTIVDFADRPSEIHDQLYQELVTFFKPALLARMEIVPYLPLSQAVLRDIIQAKLKKLHHTLYQKFGAEVVFDDEVSAQIISRATRAENGARMLESIIDGHLLPPVSLQILNKIAAGETIKFIHFGVKDNQFFAKIAECSPC